jgi:hypothetical protein
MIVVRLPLAGPLSSSLAWLSATSERADSRCVLMKRKRLRPIDASAHVKPRVNVKATPERETSYVVL